MMQKILLSVFSILVILIAAALIVPSFIDWSQYKDQIKAQVAKGTGYNLELNGPLRAAFLPFPRVTVNNASIDSNGAEGPYAFRGSVEEASVSLALLPLLSGQIAVSDVTLIKPDLAVQAQEFEPTNEASVEVENNTEANAETSSNTPAIQIDSLSLEDAKIAFTPLDGAAMNIEIPSLSVSADTLYGPFDFDGAVIYNAMNIAFEGETGEYSKTSTMPANIEVQSDDYSLTFDGIVDPTGDEMAVQGETTVTAKSLSRFNVPLKGAVNASGLLTASPSSAKLDNGVVNVGDAKAQLNLTATGLGEGQTKNINANIAFSSVINLDDILGEMTKGKSENSAASNAQGGTGQATYSYLPQTIELPADMVVRAAVTAPAIQYKGRDVSDVAVQANVNGTNVATSIKAGALPGGGAVNMNANLRAESTSRNGANGSVILANPSLAFDGNIAVQSLKTVASDWLGLIDTKTFENEAVPASINGTLGGGVNGPTIRLTSPTMAAGQYDIRGLSLRYTNAATPQFELSVDNLDGANVNVSGTAGNAKEFDVSITHPNAANAIQIVKPEFKSTPTLTKPMAFQSRVSMNDNRIAIQNMNAKLGDITATGAVNVNTSGSKPDIKAELAFGRLDTQALLGGDKSSGTPTSSGGNGAAASSQSSGAPWSREAINTEFLRTLNMDIKATAETLVHGTWTVNNPTLDIALRDGVLNVRNVNGGLFGGTVALNGQLSAPAANQPLDVDGTVKASDVDLNRLFKAATTQTTDRVLGQGSFDMDLSANGVSSSALINSLNGDGKINTTELTIIGLDLAKLTEAISDESLTDLAAAVRSMTNGGRTVFNPVSHTLTIREGTMPVENLTLQNPTATMTSNGYVSFSRWMMDLKNTVLVTEPEEMPELVINIKGPLNNPSKNVANDLIRSYVMGKYGAKINDQVDKLLGDKLRDTPVKGLINNFLGVPTQQEQQPAPTQDNAPATGTQTDATAGEQPATSTEAAPDPAPAQEEQSIEEKAIRGLFDAIGGGR